MGSPAGDRPRQYQATLQGALVGDRGILDRRIEAFGTKVETMPSEVFEQNVWISPFPEEDVVGLAELIGTDHVLFGSDWPHPEGNIEPVDYAECIQKLDPGDVKRIMRDNALALVS